MMDPREIHENDQKEAATIRQWVTYARAFLAMLSEGRERDDALALAEIIIGADRREPPIWLGELE